LEDDEFEEFKQKVEKVRSKILEQSTKIGFMRLDIDIKLKRIQEISEKCANRASITADDINFIEWEWEAFVRVV